MSIIFDTNTLISAVLRPGSVPAEALAKAVREADLAFSQATLEELVSVLGRKRFDRYLTDEDREQFLKALAPVARIFEVTCTVTDCRDPKDNMFLELAASGGVEIIVSGDSDLQALHPWRGVSIVSPATFLETALQG